MKMKRLSEKSIHILDSNEIPKTMNLSSAVTMFVGTIVGTGVFSTSGRILELVGSPGMVMVVWLLGSLIAFCGGLSYVELGLMIPQSGGDIPYLNYMYHRPKYYFPFLYVWCRVFLIFTGNTAALCSMCGTYLLNAFPLPSHLEPYKSWIVKLLAALLILIVFALTAFSNVVATKSVKWITITKMAIVLFIFVSGVISAAGGFPNTTGIPLTMANAFEGSSTSPGAYASALLKILFCFSGWAALGEYIGEIKDSEKNIPKVIIYGLSMVTLLYLGANLSYFLVLSKEEILNSQELLASKFATKLYGDVFGRQIISLAVVLAAFGCAFAVTFGASRVGMVAAQQKLLPFSSRIAIIDTRFKTPLNAIAFHCLISLLLVLIPPEDAFFFLITMTSYSVWILYTITLSGLIYLRFSEPMKQRTFKVWLVAPMLCICVGLFLAVLPFLEGGRTSLSAACGFGVMVLSFPAYYFLIFRYLPRIKAEPVTSV